MQESGENPEREMRKAGELVKTQSRRAGAEAWQLARSDTPRLGVYPLVRLGTSLNEPSGESEGSKHALSLSKGDPASVEIQGELRNTRLAKVARHSQASLGMRGRLVEREKALQDFR